MLVSASLSPAWNLSLEQCLLDGHTLLPRDAAVLFFYVNERSLIIGKHQNPWMEVSYECVQHQDPPLFRRITGGGAVYHDRGNLNFSFVQPRSVFSKEGNLELIRRALGKLGIGVSRTSRGDLYYRNWKVSGNALCYRREHVLHHGTLLIDSDLSSLQGALSIPPEIHAMYRSPSVPSVGSVTANLKDFFPFLSIPLVIEKVIEELASGGLKLIPVDDPSRTLKEPQFQSILAREESWEWVFGATPAFWFHPNGGEAGCKVEEGRIVEVRGIDEGERYVGRVFDPGLFATITQGESILARRDS